MFPVISNIATSCLSTRSLAANLADGEDGDHYWKKKKKIWIYSCVIKIKARASLEVCLPKNRNKNINLQIL